MSAVPGCRCSRCWTLHEQMLEITGKDYGLEPAPGHAPPARVRLVEAAPPSGMTDMAPGELAELQRRAKSRAKQPWDLAA